LRIPSSGRVVEGEGFRLEGAHDVLAAALIADRIVVIYDFKGFPIEAPARNLYCYDKSGRELWRAADIGMGGADAYTVILQEVPLVVSNFAGFAVTVSLDSGTVQSKKFTK
jgi:hypothetical protein